MFNVAYNSSIVEIVKKIKAKFKKWNAYWIEIERIRMECMVKSGRGFWQLIKENTYQKMGGGLNIMIIVGLKALKMNFGLMVRVKYSYLDPKVKV